MNIKKNYNRVKLARRHTKIRTKIFGTAEKPRLAVFRSNKYMYAQLIDDVKGNTLASFSSLKASGKTPMDKAKAVGVEIANQAKSKKIESVVFDRGGFRYTGRILAVAMGAREGGLKF